MPRSILTPALDLADTLEARAEASQPLSTAELLAIAQALRSIVNDWRPVAEFADGVVEDARLAARVARVVSLRPALGLVQGGRA